MLAATELGAGFKIAMKDLEIRGAGNILGLEQSGHIHAVGFNLYSRLLGLAVDELRAQRALGDTSEQDGGAAIPSLSSANGPEGPDDRSLQDEILNPPVRVRVDLDIPASISHDYISDLPVRLGIYHRLIKLEELEEVGGMEDELRDRFGPLPWEVQNLLYVARLKLRAQRAGVASITREDDRIVLWLEDEVGGARQAVQRLLGKWAVVGNSKIRMDAGQFPDGWEQPLMDAMEKMADFRERLETGIQAAVAR